MRIFQFQHQKLFVGLCKRQSIPKSNIWVFSLLFYSCIYISWILLLSTNPQDQKTFFLRILHGLYFLEEVSAYNPYLLHPSFKSSYLTVRHDYSCNSFVCCLSIGLNKRLCRGGFLNQFNFLRNYQNRKKSRVEDSLVQERYSTENNELDINAEEKTDIGKEKEKQKKIKGAGNDQNNKTPFVQAMDFTTLLLLIDEMKDVILPSRIENVIQVDAYTIYMQLRTLSNGSPWFTVCWHPKFARISLSYDPPFEENKMKTKLYTLTGTMKTLLASKFINNIEVPFVGERVVKLSISTSAITSNQDMTRTDSMEKHIVNPVETEMELYIEIMGKRSNFALVELDDQKDKVEEDNKNVNLRDTTSSLGNKILCCGYQVSPTKSIRPLAVGAPFTLPPMLTTPLPTKERASNFATFYDSLMLIPQYSLTKALLTSYRGLHGKMIDVMAESVGILASESIESIDVAKIELFFHGPFSAWINTISSLYYPKKKEDLNDFLSTTNNFCTPIISFDGKEYCPLNFFNSSSLPSSVISNVNISNSTVINHDGEGKVPTRQYWSLLNLDYDKFNERNYNYNTVKEEKSQNKRMKNLRPKQSIQYLVDHYYRDTFRRYMIWDLKRKSLQKCSQVHTKLKKIYDSFEEKLRFASIENIESMERQCDLYLANVYRYNELLEERELEIEMIKEEEDAIREKEREENKNTRFKYKAKTTGNPEIESRRKINILEVEDFHNENKKIELPLLDGCTPIEMSQLLYKKIGKGKRSKNIIEPILKDLKIKLDYIEEIILSLEQCQGHSELELENIRDIAEEVQVTSEFSFLPVFETGLSSLSPKANRYAGHKERTYFTSLTSKSLTYSNFKLGDEDTNTFENLQGEERPSSNLPNSQFRVKGSSKSKNSKTNNKKKNSKSTIIGKEKPKEKNKGGAKINNGGYLTIPLPLDFIKKSFGYDNNMEKENENQQQRPITILVGRNSKQNDSLTFTIAQDHELWFHARGVPGAHVLLRYDPGTEIKDEHIQIAADIASFFSKNRNNNKVEVSMISPKYLKKVAKGPPGLVQFTRNDMEEVVLGRPFDGGKFVE